MKNFDYMKKSTMIILSLLIALICCCSCKENLELENGVKYDKLSWTKDTEEYTLDSVTYSYKKSSDGKYCWITRIKLVDNNKLGELVFPNDIEGAILLRIGFDVKDATQDKTDVMYNVFGTPLYDDDFEYPKEFSSIETVILPDSVQNIEDGAFTGLYSLKKINCPKELVRIGNGAFNLCSGLQEFAINSKVTEIGDGAFAECTRLEKLPVSPNNKKYYEQGGLIIDKEKKQAIMAISGKKEIILPSNIELFSKRCFDDSSVNKISLESGDNRFIKKDDYIYKKSDKALLIGIVNGEKAILPEGIEEVNEASKFIGKDLKVVEFPKSIRCLRGAWLDSFDGEDCTYVFKSKQPPKIVEPSKNVSSVPIGSKIFVPEQSLKEYKKWFKINGGEMSRIEKIS
ncbi:MAG: leucine-rich repeat domain-containing protein [Eubacterium sp.]|nr:leucine-rich repeat domain-containing protein [Eubacterium sp.]